MREKWEEYGIKHQTSLFGDPDSDNLYTITTHEQRIKLDEVIEEITGKWCDDGVAQLTDDEIIEILDQVLKAMAKKRGKELEKEIAGMIA